MGREGFGGQKRVEVVSMHVVELVLESRHHRLHACLRKPLARLPAAFDAFGRQRGLNR